MNDLEMDDDLLAMIASEVRTIVSTLNSKRGDEIAAAVVNRVVSRFGGAQVYVPRKTSAERRLRDQRIRDEFNGTNIRYLARKFMLSERTVRRLLR